MSCANAVKLMCVMLERARRNDRQNIYGLKKGQCFLGDFRNYDMTEKQYRGAKKKLEEWEFASFEGTRHGTIGTLRESSLLEFD